MQRTRMIMRCMILFLVLLVAASMPSYSQAATESCGAAVAATVVPSVSPPITQGQTFNMTVRMTNDSVTGTTFTDVAGVLGLGGLTPPLSNTVVVHLACADAGTNCNSPLPGTLVFQSCTPNTGIGVASCSGSAASNDVTFTMSSPNGVPFTAGQAQNLGTISVMAQTPILTSTGQFFIAINNSSGGTSFGDNFITNDSLCAIQVRATAAGSSALLFPPTEQLLVSKTCTNGTCTDATINEAITVTNNGQEDLCSVVITDTLNGGAPTDITSSCTFPGISGQLAIGQTATCSRSYQGTPGATTSDTANATASGCTSGIAVTGVPPQGQSNTASCSVPLVPSVTAVKTCNSTLACTDTSASFNIHVTVSNTGGAAWTGTVTDSSCGLSNSPISGTGDTSVDVPCTITGGYPAISNSSGGTVSVTTAAGCTSPGSINTASCPITCQPCIQAVKTCTSPTACSDTTIPVQVVLSNCSTGSTAEALTNISLTDNPAVTFSCTPALSTGIPIGSSTITCTGSYTGKSGSNTDTITVSANGATSNLSAAIGAGSQLTSNVCTVTPCTPCLKAVKTCTSPTACGDTTIPVQVVLSNCDTVGGSTSEALGPITLTDNPAVSFTCSPTDPSAGLAVGASTTCTGSYTGKSGTNTDTITVSANGVDGVPAVIDPTSQLTSNVCTVTPCGSLTVVKSCSVAPACSTDTTIGVSVVITNTSTVTVSGISATDNKASNLTCPSTSLAAGASMTCTGSYAGTAGQASTDTVTVTVSDTSVTVTYLANANGDTPGTATCTPPTPCVGACRMTGGHVETCQTYGCSDDPTTVCSPNTSPDTCVGLKIGTCSVPLTTGLCTYPTFDVTTSKITPVRVQRGNKNTTLNQTVVYTTGGQIGAPDATGTDGAPLCCDTPPGPGRDPNCPSGSWEHNQQSGAVQWTDGGGLETFTGSFDFHSGTASAPVQAFIHSILCADEGWCVQARCAPDKQIFWEGTGVFHAIGSTTNFPNCTGADLKVYANGAKDNSYSVHYYRAHVGDFGEPGSNNQQVPPGSCAWSDGPAGVSISSCELNGFQPIPGITCTTDADCSSVLNGATCQDGQCIAPAPFDSRGGDVCSQCPDWYEIEIHCGLPASQNPTIDQLKAQPIIYKVGNFITNGNFQIHPEVGSNCFDTFPK